MALIFTTKGEMDESLLERTEGVVDNENEHTTWVEYRFDGEVVRRDVHVALKQGIDMASIAEGF
jgi:hypothetical protein